MFLRWLGLFGAVPLHQSMASRLLDDFMELIRFFTMPWVCLKIQSAVSIHWFIDSRPLLRQVLAASKDEGDEVRKRKNGPTSRGNRLQKRIRKPLIAIETNMGKKWLKHVETNKEIYSFHQKWGLDHEKSVENGLKVHPNMGYDQVPMVTVYLRREVKH